MNNVDSIGTGLIRRILPSPGKLIPNSNFQTIHLLALPFVLGGLRGTGWSQSQLTLGRGGVHTGQVASPSQAPTYRDKQTFVLTFTPTGHFQCPINLSCISHGLWEEAAEQKEHADSLKPVLCSYTSEILGSQNEMFHKAAAAEAAPQLSCRLHPGSSLCGTSNFRLD